MAGLRVQIGLVSQEPLLFSASILDNIRYGNPNATDAEVEAVARQVGGGDWLQVLPNGLATEISEQGRGISMGQRQLVALARVLLQNPSIVILDEATASIDPLTEAQIQEGLDVVLQERFNQRHFAGKVIKQPAFAQPGFGGYSFQRQAG